MTVALRAPLRDEVSAITALINELGQALHGENLSDENEVESWFTTPSIDPERDLLVAEGAGGRLDAAGAVIDVAEDHAIIWIRVALHPERGTDELADRMLESLERRARERGADESLVHAGCPSLDTRARALFERHGYRLARLFFRMLVDLDAPLAEPLWPDGIELRPFDADRHFELVHEADEEAFDDHWGSVRTSFDEWRHYMTTGRHFDPELWFIAWDGDEIAGFSLCNPQEGGDTELGWVHVLGVRRPWRRRGLALALLLHSFGEFRRRGLKRAGLGVDAENLTGALRLYERAGMRVVRQFDAWEKRAADITRPAP